MYENFKKEFNANQKLLRTLLKKKDTFTQAIDLCLEQHAIVNSSEFGRKSETLFDLVTDNMHEECFRKLQDKDYRTILFHIWHTTRIEDITVNILVNNKQQVFLSENWQAKINTYVTDTGNSMTSEEILKHSSKININELLNYRLAVAKETKNTLLSLKPEDLKRTFSPEQNKRILDEHAVLTSEKSIWLIDFWGRKNVAGILLMPVTRHHIVHINACMRLKKKCDKGFR